MKRKYTRLHKDSHRVMHRLYHQHKLRYHEIAELFDCSRGRVVQIITDYKEPHDPQEDTGPADAG